MGTLIDLTGKTFGRWTVIGKGMVTIPANRRVVKVAPKPPANRQMYDALQTRKKG